MRHCLLPILLLLAACSSDGTTRDFALSRDSAPQTVASTRLPLSVPPLLASRPDAFRRAGGSGAAAAGRRRRRQRRAGCPGAGGRPGGDRRYPRADQREFRHGLSAAGHGGQGDELDAATGLHLADCAGVEGLVQPDVLSRPTAWPVRASAALVR